MEEEKQSDNKRIVSHNVIARVYAKLQVDEKWDKESYPYEIVGGISSLAYQIAKAEYLDLHKYEYGTPDEEHYCKRLPPEYYRDILRKAKSTLEDYIKPYKLMKSRMKSKMYWALCIGIIIGMVADRICSQVTITTVWATWIASVSTAIAAIATGAYAYHYIKCTPKS